MEILITICGRGGSKGIAGKNIKSINNIPLIAYSIHTAQLFQKLFVATISLSTDSEEIKKVAQDYGLVTDYTRPHKLATDSAGKIEVIKDLLLYQESENKKQYDYVLDLDITSPLRTIDDLKKGFEILSKNENALNLFSVNPANRNPYFNMVELDSEGYAHLSKSSSDEFLTRQSAPKVYDMNASFYFYRRAFFEKNYSKAITDKSLIYIMPHICFDLDEMLDFEFLSYLIKNNKLNFQLW